MNVIFFEPQLHDIRISHWFAIIITTIIMGIIGSMIGYANSFIALSMVFGVGFGTANVIFGTGSDVIGLTIAGIFLSAAVNHNKFLISRNATDNTDKSGFSILLISANTC